VTQQHQLEPATVVGVGAGHRTFEYCRYALDHPDRMKVVAIAEPDAIRRRRFAEVHGIPSAMQFESYEQLASGPPLAQAVVNGTMDQLHYQSTMPLLAAGYHVLLEKPIAQSEQHVRDLIDSAREHKRVVMICHVLRYAPFYRRIKDLLDEGAIGSIVAMTSNENVSYHHMAVGFIRGRWRKTEANPMLLAKCCHDLDIIAWLMTGTTARRVASFGSLMQFKPANAPPGSTRRCLDGCQVEATCAYSAYGNYITQGLWGPYAWESIEHLENPTEEQKIESLRTDNPFGRCVWHCDNDVVDHQSVIIEFANGVTATHNMFCATARPTRTIHIVGTQGELEADMEDGLVKLRTPRRDRLEKHAEEVIDVNITGGEGQGGHGGGDERLVADFASILRGNEPSKSVTNIQDSLTGHLIAFAADTAMREGRVVEL
jgi:predicted dehydrogenase